MNAMAKDESPRLGGKTASLGKTEFHGIRVLGRVSNSQPTKQDGGRPALSV